MLFDVIHFTDYRYSHPVSEAYVEARLTPPRRKEQEVLGHRIEFSPQADTSNYVDYFGNTTTFYSMTLRHERLLVTNRMTVRTRSPEKPGEALALTVAEARQILASSLTDVFDYLQPTPAVPTGGSAMDWARKIFRGSHLIGEALLTLNRMIHERFAYKPGATELHTPLATVWKTREGVCQDFAHVMLSVLRTAGLPARYVCGYIETDGPGKLVGSVATHAWVEVMLPGLQWIALDPTNNQCCGERHVTVALGRDFEDASPVRGTFKGSGTQHMKVRVTMKRLADTP
ncbi:MAG: transglutaminase family protein [Chthoniobacterales bacterium]|nr:transglutaminase family protein [Chthoniobacterales bacterium]